MKHKRKHDPSEIIQICWFGAQKTFVFINIETVVLPNIFVETKDSLMNIKLKRIFLKYMEFNL